jgi:hypothetical protein
MCGVEVEEPWYARRPPHIKSRVFTMPPTSIDRRGRGTYFEGTEQGLLGSEDLYCAGRILGKIGQRARLGNKPRSYGVTDKSGKVGSNGVHPLREIVAELSSISGQ